MCPTSVSDVALSSTNFFFLVFYRLEVYFHTCDEILHMWAHAEDLTTLEFSLMQVTSYITGPVRIITSVVVFLVLLIRARLSRMCPLS